MNNFSVPADFTAETIDQYDILNHTYIDKVSETYGQLNEPGNPYGSGRASDHMPYCDHTTLKKYIDYAKGMNIGFNYVLNTTCLSNEEFSVAGIKKFINFLKHLIDIGVESVTVCLPSLIELIIESGLPLKIKGSTVCCITNAERAKTYKTMGVHRIVVDESINRDFESLKRINTIFPGELEMIVNVICNKNCIYRSFHHNQMSHDFNYGQKSISYYSYRCMLKRVEEPENLLKMCFVRPEDLCLYEKIPINRYKIQGRQAVLNGNIPKTVEAYMKKSFDGNLLDLLDCFSPTNSFRFHLENRLLNTFLDPFCQTGFCNNNCDDCNYCENYMKSHFDIDAVKSINKMALRFYKTTDNYKRTIKEVMEGNDDGKN
jgi:collagenase-like PrtC family protease